MMQSLLKFPLQFLPQHIQFDQIYLTQLSTEIQFSGLMLSKISLVTKV